MPGQPSFYFTLFKKFQAIDHVQSATLHGAPGGGGTGFDLTSPGAPAGVFSFLAGGDTNPADSPLWAILNSRAMGNAGLTPVTITGPKAGTYPTMPVGTPQAWQDFQLTPTSNTLLDVFGTWISDGQINDTPTTVIGTKPAAPIPGPLDSGVSLFVCSMPGDTGVRPGGVPSNYWATSLIFLTDQNTGATVFPSTLTAASEYNLAAVIGNRGNTDGGIYLESGAGTGIETAAIVMIFGTSVSPGVELPSLSNLDVTATNQIYEQYFLNSAQYDVVGFRLNVQTVYNGIAAAIVASGLNLGGLTVDQWMHGPGAHLCAKVVIRDRGGSFPDYGDTPVNNNKIAQRNIAPFNADVSVTSPDPNIQCYNFVMGQPFYLKLPGAGANRLTLTADLPRDAVQLYLAVTEDAFQRFFADGRGGVIKGFQQLSCEDLCRSPLGNRAKPFPEAVVLRWGGHGNAIELPAMPDRFLIGMSLGIEYNVKKLKPGNLGEINVSHHCRIPRLTPGTCCFEIQDTLAGGFTIVATATDPNQAPSRKQSKR